MLPQQVAFRNLVELKELPIEGLPTSIKSQLYMELHNSSKQNSFSPVSKVSTMFTQSSMPSTSSVLSSYTTFAASAMLVRSVFNEVRYITNDIIRVIPRQIQEKIVSKVGWLVGRVGRLASRMTITIDVYDGLSANQVFEAAQVYLRTIIGPSVLRLKVSKTPKDNALSVTSNNGEKITDIYEGIQLEWKMICVQTRKTRANANSRFPLQKVEDRSLELSFDKKHKERVLSSYLPYVLERSKVIKEESKVVKLYSLGNYDGVKSVNLDHPSTFDTMAMDPMVKKELMDDLDRFVNRRKFYRRVGKAWKRGYLLYGPPGTGKSSLVAAMANYLKFDIYDLELTSLMNNNELKRLLTTTKNRSILVIEDIDCSLDLQNRKIGGPHNPLAVRYGRERHSNQLTLSGLLNFIDGLWSSCGDERIIVFTTNHKDRLDPALLRPGRMDKHIHMSYCTFSGFKTLASNYLSVASHCMFSEIEKLITEVEVTPAEIAEELMKSEEAEAALGGVTKLLKRKRMECDQKSDGGKENQEEGKESEEVKECDEKKVRNKKAKSSIGKGMKLKEARDNTTFDIDEEWIEEEDEDPLLLF